MPELNVSLGALALKNPVMPASGCFAIEYSEALDFNQLGAMVLKSVSRYHARVTLYLVSVRLGVA